MIRSKLNVVEGWGADFSRAVNERVRVELGEASETGARVASEIANSRRRTGKMAEMEVLDVVGTGTGWQGGFRSGAWYARFQSGGTKTGIQPLRFLEKGRAAARKQLVERLNRI